MTAYNIVFYVDQIEINQAWTGHKTAAKMVQQELREDEEEAGKSEPKHDDVRILLVGDPGVGKTSLIYSLVNDEFDTNLPARMADITIPAQVTPENVSINVVDYSDREQSPDDLNEAIKDANVICIVYDACDEDSLNRVAKRWIPTVRRCQQGRGTYKPIILAANKTDLVQQEIVLDNVSAIIQEFVDIEAFIEVSALSQKNVVELFSAAQKAITCPLAPLFDPQMRVLTKKCRNALVEIFKLSDLDGDGLLSDHELNLFQENCFGTPLQKDALDDLKLIIKQSTIDGIVNDSLTQAGFLFLHTLSIDKGRLDFTWQVLRKFNYDNQVNVTCNNSKLLTDTIDDFSHNDSLSSVLYDSGGSHFKSDSETSEDESELTNNLDLAWIREHKNIVGAGLGLTIATLLSILALKYLVRSSSRSSV